MQLYPAIAKGPVVIPGYIDPDDPTIIEVFWGAPSFVPGTLYRLGTIVKPTVENGYYYKCIVTGLSGSTEPTWLGKKVLSGTVMFKAIPYDLFIKPSESITASTWTVTGLVTIDTFAYDTMRTSCIIQVIPGGLLYFDLTNQVSKANGEKLSRTFRYNVNQQ